MVRTRIVCVSDTHSYSPADAAFKLPKGDVLIHAGDLTKHGTLAQLRRTVEWIEKADFEVKIVIAGNHDIALDRAFYTTKGASIHESQTLSPEDVDACITLLKNNPKITYLEHESATIRLTKPSGPKTAFKVFGSPYIPISSGAQVSRKMSAFGYDPESADAEAEAVWESIPLDADVVVTHGPARMHRDFVEGKGNVGCEALRKALWRVRPRLAVCGHVHEFRGAERVRWDLSAPGEEVETKEWLLPPRGSKKQSLVALAGGKGVVLDNDGRRDTGTTTTIAESESDEMMVDASVDLPASPIDGVPASEMSYEIEVDSVPKGRNETCVVNASIFANSFPYTGGKKFNAPIMVDLDLPLNEEFGN